MLGLATQRFISAPINTQKLIRSCMHVIPSSCANPIKHILYSMESIAWLNMGTRTIKNQQRITLSCMHGPHRATNP